MEDKNVIYYSFRANDGLVEFAKISPKDKICNLNEQKQFVQDNFPYLKDIRIYKDLDEYNKVMSY